MPSVDSVRQRHLDKLPAAPEPGADPPGVGSLEGAKRYIIERMSKASLAEKAPRIIAAKDFQELAWVAAERRTGSGGTASLKALATYLTKHETTDFQDKLGRQIKLNRGSDGAAINRVTQRELRHLAVRGDFKHAPAGAENRRLEQHFAQNMEPSRLGSPMAVRLAEESVGLFAKYHQLMSDLDKVDKDLRFFFKEYENLKSDTAIKAEEKTQLEVKLEHESKSDTGIKSEEKAQLHAKINELNAKIDKSNTEINELDAKIKDEFGKMNLLQNSIRNEKPKLLDSARVFLGPLGLSNDQITQLPARQKAHLAGILSAGANHVSPEQVSTQNALARLYKNIGQTGTPPIPAFMPRSEVEKRNDLHKMLRGDASIQSAGKNWGVLDEEAKKTILQEIANHHAKAYGLPEIPLRFEDLERNCWGYCSNTEIVIGRNMLNLDPGVHAGKDNNGLFAELADTVIHENMHRYQNHLVAELTSGNILESDDRYDQALFMKANKDFYFNARRNYGDYRNQPRESHAWHEGNLSQKCV